jgi:hypothetical protein
MSEKGRPEIDKLQLPSISVDFISAAVGPGTPSRQSGSRSPISSVRNSVTKPSSLPSGILVEGKHVPPAGIFKRVNITGSAYFNFSHDNIKQTSIRLRDEDAEDEDDDELYGEAQGLDTHAPKKSAGQMSRASKNSKNSAASSDKGDRLDEIFIQPFVRAIASAKESRLGLYAARVANKVSSKVFFWSFLSIVNIAVILVIFWWAAGQ